MFFGHLYLLSLYDASSQYLLMLLSTAFPMNEPCIRLTIKAINAFLQYSANLEIAVDSTD